MLTPRQAYERLIRDNRRGLDDPTEPGYPLRWYFGSDGLLRSCPWSSPCSTSYPDFRLAEGRDGPCSA
jgi:hypothetical protein